MKKTYSYLELNHHATTLQLPLLVTKKYYQILYQVKKYTKNMVVLYLNLPQDVIKKNIVPIASLALKIAKIEKKQLNAIAFTRGPGLLGSLLVGTSFAKSLSLSLKLPLIEINHMRAHVIANFIEKQ